MSMFGSSLFSQGYLNVMFIYYLSEVVFTLLYCVLQLVPTGKNLGQHH